MTKNALRNMDGRAFGKAISKGCYLLIKMIQNNNSMGTRMPVNFILTAVYIHSFCSSRSSSFFLFSLLLLFLFLFLFLFILLVRLHVFLHLLQISNLFFSLDFDMETYSSIKVTTYRQIKREDRNRPMSLK